MWSSATVFHTLKGALGQIVVDHSLALKMPGSHWCSAGKPQDSEVSFNAFLPLGGQYNNIHTQRCLLKSKIGHLWAPWPSCNRPVSPAIITQEAQSDSDTGSESQGMTSGEWGRNKGPILSCT